MEPVLAVVRGDDGGDGIGVLLQGAQFVATADLSAEVDGVRLERLLDPGLRDAQRVRVVGVRA